MIISDYTCLSCNHIFEVSKKKVLDEWPKNVVCPNCGSTETQRKFTPLVFDIAEGKAGNAKSGYATSVTYHGSELGRYKGKKIVKEK